MLSFFFQGNYLPLFTICSLCPIYSFLFILQFLCVCVERIFLWCCKHASFEQVFTHSPDSAGVFLMCFHYLLCNIKSKALISSITVWQQEYLSVALYDGWQIKGKNINHLSKLLSHRPLWEESQHSLAFIYEFLELYQRNRPLFFLHWVIWCWLQCTVYHWCPKSPIGAQLDWDCCDWEGIANDLHSFHTHHSVIPCAR